MNVAVVPSNPVIEQAVRDAGATPTPPKSADALVWVDPTHPERLADVLRDSPARWVQLPFAGIERFVAAGVVTPDRVWTCAKEIYGTTCAELAVGLIVAGARKLHEHARRSTWWRDVGDTHRRVAGTTAVIVGTGGIGKALATMLKPMRVETLGVNRSGTPSIEFPQTWPVESLLDVVPRADWLVIAAAATPRTARLIDASVLAAMKPASWLVNVARGTLVDTDALVDALRRGSIGGAALDVTDPEPLPDGHALWSLPNAIVTSHTANTYAMAMPDLAALVRGNIERFAAGETLEGLVDPALGY